MGYIPTTFWIYLRNFTVIVLVVIILGLFIPQLLRSQKDIGGVQKQSEPFAVQDKKSQELSTVSGPTYTDQISGMELVFVKGGCFDMSAVIRDGKAEKKSVQPVCVDDFYIGKYELTQAQWYRVIGLYPARRRQRCDGSGNCAMASVTWERAQTFIKALSRKSGKNYRIPTGAEWEYAARSRGKKEKWAGTNNELLLRSYAWYDANSGGRAHHVGLKKPNGIGLYDMSGNLWEWVVDRYEGSGCRKSRKNDLHDTDHSHYRVLRGGSWFYPARFALISYRRSPHIRIHHIGLRLALTP